MSTDFQHTAYIASRRALQEARKAATRQLSDECPDAMEESLVPAIDQALRLCQEAARLMQQMQQLHAKDKVVAELKRRCPGYPERTYEAAAVDAFTDYIR